MSMTSASPDAPLVRFRYAELLWRLAVLAWIPRRGSRRRAAPVGRTALTAFALSPSTSRVYMARLLDVHELVMHGDAPATIAQHEPE